MYSDRLTTCHTVVVLLVFAAVVLLVPSVVDRIRCFPPAQMSQAQADMVQASCYGAPWYLAADENVPSEDRETTRQVAFYHWTGVLLVLQAFLFYLPSPMWIALQRLCGINVHGLLATASGFKGKDENLRRRYFRGVAKILRSASGGSCSLTACYSVIKVVHLVTSVGQLVWLNRFLGSRVGGYGLEALHHIRTDTILSETPTFPRQVLCDLALRQLGNVHRYTLQCSLPVNHVFEGVYILVWFWLVFVATTNVASLADHVITMSVPGWQRAFVTSRITALGDSGQSSIQVCKDEYLIVRQMAAVDEVLAAEVLLGLVDERKHLMTHGGKMEPRGIPSAPLYPNVGTL